MNQPIQRQNKGTIILLDGPSGCGKSTLAVGWPEPRAVLDTEDGWRWLREYAHKYEHTRDVVRGKFVLAQWANDKEVASVIADTYSFVWLAMQMEVEDKPDKEKFRSWGTAKLTCRGIHQPLIKAKVAGKHVLLTAHTKENITVDTSSSGRTQITKEGLKADTEAILGEIVDIHLRMFIDLKADKRWLNVVKCRASKRDTDGRIKPLLPSKWRLDIPLYESDKMAPLIFEAIGALPDTHLGTVDVATESTSAAQAMKSARNASR